MGGVMLQDPVTGRILTTRPQSLQERFPTGRKCCTGPCGRWRHLHDFSPRGRYMQSWCRVCRQRWSRKGDHPRQPVSRVGRNQRKRAEWAAWIARVKADPIRYEEYLETQRLRGWDRRRAQGIPMRIFKAREDRSRTLTDPTLFLEWVDLTCPVLSDTEGRRIREARRTGGQLALRTIDQVLTRNGAHFMLNILCPLDEKPQAA